MFCILQFCESPAAIVPFAWKLLTESQSPENNAPIQAKSRDGNSTYNIVKSSVTDCSPLAVSA